MQYFLQEFRIVLLACALEKYLNTSESVTRLPDTNFSTSICVAGEMLRAEYVFLWTSKCCTSINVSVVIAPLDPELLDAPRTLDYQLLLWIEEQE